MSLFPFLCKKIFAKVILFLLLSFFFNPGQCISSIHTQKTIEIRGRLIEVVSNTSGFIRKSIENIQKAEIKVIGGHRGQVFSDGEFLIELPSSIFVPGQSFSIIVSSSNYIQRTPYETAVSNYPLENNNNEIVLERLSPNTKFIVGQIMSKDLGSPVSGASIICKQYPDTKTVSDGNGLYKLPIELGIRRKDDFNIIVSHEYFNQKSIDVSESVSVDKKNYTCDVFLDLKRGGPVIASLPPGGLTEGIVYTIDNTREAIPSKTNDGGPMYSNQFVYYYWGTKRSLLREGILERSGKFIFKWFSKPRLKKNYVPDVNKNYQRARKYDLNEISPIGSSVIYPSAIYPPRDESSFKILQRGTLRIDDKELFWKHTNFVILRVH